MKVLLAVDALTFDDRIDFEAETGTPLGEALALMVKQRATLEQQRALVWIFSRMIDRTFTLEDAGSVRTSEVEWEIPGPDDEDGD